MGKIMGGNAYEIILKKLHKGGIVATLMVGYPIIIFGPRTLHATNPFRF